MPDLMFHQFRGGPGEKYLRCVAWGAFENTERPVQFLSVEIMRAG